MIITPSINATKRTKNKLREHFGWTIIKQAVVLAFPGKESVFLKASDGYVAWFPLDELVLGE